METTVVATVGANDGEILNQILNSTNETIITGKVNGGIVQIIKNVALNQILEILEPQQIKVNGVVYFDANNDRIKQTEETVISRAAVKVLPNEMKTFTNTEGKFSFYTSENNMQLAVLAENGLTASVAPLNLDVTTYKVSDVLEIAAIPVCNGTDLKLSMGGTAIRKGYNNGQFRIVATNQTRNVTENFTINFVVPAQITILNPSIPLTQQQSFVENGKTYIKYTWSIASLNPFENKVISFSHGNAATVLIGDLFNFKGEILANNQDCTPLDNTLEQTYLVYGQ